MGCSSRERGALVLLSFLRVFLRKISNPRRPSTSPHLLVRLPEKFAHSAGARSDSRPLFSFPCPPSDRS